MKDPMHPSHQVEARIAQLAKKMGMKRYELLDQAIRPMELKAEEFTNSQALRSYVLGEPAARPAKAKRRSPSYFPPRPQVTPPEEIPEGAMPEREIAELLDVHPKVVSDGGRDGRHARWWTKSKSNAAPLALAMPDEVEKWVKERGK